MTQHEHTFEVHPNATLPEDCTTCGGRDWAHEDACPERRCMRKLKCDRPVIGAVYDVNGEWPLYHCAKHEPPHVALDRAWNELMDAFAAWMKPLLDRMARMLRRFER